jgi:hypothetical protein
MWFHPQTAVILAKLLEVPVSQVDMVMGNDVRMTWVNNNAAMEGIVHEHDGEGHVDPWGIQWVKAGPYNQIQRFPLIHAMPDELRRYQFPVEHQEALLARMKPLLASRDEYFIGCDVSPCVFEMWWRLRGLEQTVLEIRPSRRFSRICRMVTAGETNFWAVNRRANWKVASHFVNLGELLLLGVYPSAVQMPNVP